MLFSKPAVVALVAAAGTQAAAIEKRQDEFQCKPGFVLTAYTTAGVGTCTKVAGSSIAAGYSGQTVVYVGILGGLTGLITATLPLTKYLAKSGYAYFRQPNAGQQWVNAFPRDVDSTVDPDGLELQRFLHNAWTNAHGKLQQNDFDAGSHVEFSGNDNSTGATYSHSGFDFAHHFGLVPHNETHDTYDHHFSVVASNPVLNSGSFEKRSDTWSGVRIVVSNAPVQGEVNAVGLSSSVIHGIANDQTTFYLNTVTGQHSQLCTVLGSAPHAHKHFGIEIDFLSQIDGGAFQSSECSPFPEDDLPNDEL